MFVVKKMLRFFKMYIRRLFKGFFSATGRMFYLKFTQRLEICLFDENCRVMTASKKNTERSVFNVINKNFERIAETIIQVP